MIRLAAERIAQSLNNDDWVYHQDADERYLMRKGMTLSVSLSGTVRVGPGTSIPRDRVPLNWSESRMLSKLAKEKLQVIIAKIANTPEPKP